jgi:hypothetical protein
VFPASGLGMAKSGTPDFARERVPLPQPNTGSDANATKRIEA